MYFDPKEKALNSKHVMFDSHPVFIKQWYDGVDFDPNEFKVAPVWVQLPELPLRYWGCIMKLVKSLGEPVQLDMATRNRERIHYARVLVEMDITKDFPKFIRFKNEKGKIVKQQTCFEWQPITTVHAAARSKKGTQIWKPKQVQPKVGNEVCAAGPNEMRASKDAPDIANGGQVNNHVRAAGSKENDDGFKKVKKGASTHKVLPSIRNTTISNHFEVIQVQDVTDGNGDNEECVRQNHNAAHG